MHNDDNIVVMSRQWTGQHKDVEEREVYRLMLLYDLATAVHYYVHHSGKGFPSAIARKVHHRDSRLVADRTCHPRLQGPLFHAPRSPLLFAKNIKTSLRLQLDLAEACCLLHD